MYDQPSRRHLWRQRLSPSSRSDQEARMRVSNITRLALAVALAGPLAACETEQQRIPLISAQVASQLPASSIAEGVQGPRSPRVLPLQHSRNRRTEPKSRRLRPVGLRRRRQLVTTQSSVKLIPRRGRGQRGSTRPPIPCLPTLLEPADAEPWTVVPTCRGRAEGARRSALSNGRRACYRWATVPRRTRQ